MTRACLRNSSGGGTGAALAPDCCAGVAYGARLLENLLLHEMLEAALFRQDRVPSDVLERTFDHPALEIHQPDAARGEHGNVAVGEEENVAGVMQERRDVARDEVFALAQADHRRRAVARGYHLVRVVRRDHRHRVDARQAADGREDGVLERAAVRIFFDQVGDDLGIGLGDEFVALGGELALELEVVLDDAVVDDYDLAGAVAVRVGVELRRPAVGGPARVGDAHHALGLLRPNALLEDRDLADGARQVRLVVQDGDAARVVAAVLKPLQTLNQHFASGLVSNIADNSAHR